MPYEFPVTRKMCAMCLERPATKHVLHPLDIFLCLRCFLHWLKDMADDTEIIQENVINPGWEPNL